MAQLHKKISQLMAEKNITATDIQRTTGLNRNTVYSIIAGNSKNPSASNLQLIAKALDVSLDNFLIDEATTPLGNLNKEQLICYKEVTIRIIDTLLNKELDIGMDKLIDLIKETYQYSIKSSPHDIDQRFIEWIIDKQK